MRAAALLLVALLPGCAMFRSAEKPQPTDIAPRERVTERIRHVFLPQPCGRIKKAWLRGQATEKKAEGVIADALPVAEARGKQVDTLNVRISDGNTNLTKIEAVLKKYGCGELER
jgi:hypothetical protein